MPLCRLLTPVPCPAMSNCLPVAQLSPALGQCPNHPLTGCATAAVQEEAEALQRELEQKTREEAERQRKLDEAAEKQRRREAELDARKEEERRAAAAAPLSRPPAAAPADSGAPPSMRRWAGVCPGMVQCGCDGCLFNQGSLPGGCCVTVSP